MSQWLGGRGVSVLCRAVPACCWATGSGGSEGERGLERGEHLLEQYP